jgi:hypothetical protein
MSNLEEDKQTILTLAKHWVYAVVFQGERTIKHLSGDPWEEFKLWGQVLSAEEHYFVISINHARNWLELLFKSELQVKEFSTDFMKATKDAKEVRDMMEHQDEYIRGGGKFPDKYKRKLSTATGHAIEVEANSSFLNPEEYWIGGKLDVKAIIESARILDNRLSELLDMIDERMSE